MINPFNIFRKKESKSIAEMLKPIEALEKKLVPLEIDLPVNGNYQSDNKSFIRIPPSSQCGYTTLAVLLSQFIQEATGDKFISDMIEFFEKDFITGKKNSRFGSAMNNHVFMANFYLKKNGIEREVVFKEHSGSVQDVIDVLKKGYAVGVAGMMTSSGHFMPITGYSELRNSFKVQDPYKRFDFIKKKYTNESGLNCYYPIEEFYPYLSQSSNVVSGGTKKGIRFYYIGDKK